MTKYTVEWLRGTNPSLAVAAKYIVEADCAEDAFAKAVNKHEHKSYPHIFITWDEGKQRFDNPNCDPALKRTVAAKESAKPKLMVSENEETVSIVDRDDIYVVKEDENAGPYTYKQIKSMWTSGLLTADLYCRIGSGKGKILIKDCIEKHTGTVNPSYSYQKNREYEQPEHNKRTWLVIGCSLIALLLLAVMFGGSRQLVGKVFERKIGNSGLDHKLIFTSKSSVEMTSAFGNKNLMGTYFISEKSVTVTIEGGFGSKPNKFLISDSSLIENDGTKWHLVSR